MSSARKTAKRARLVWEQGARVKFHYTEPGYAEQILAEQLYRVPAEPGSQGHGLYATTVQPRAMPDEKLLDLLFARGRPTIAIEGVAVLRDDAFQWRRYSHRSYVYNADPGEALDLSLALVGIGIRRRGNWLWSNGIYLPLA